MVLLFFFLQFSCSQEIKYPTKDINSYLSSFVTRQKDEPMSENVLTGDIGSEFRSFNFKLIIINELLSKGYYKDECIALKAKYWKWDDYRDEPIEAIKEFCESIEIGKKELLEIDTITFDGGNNIYHLLIPNWGGEDDQFNINTLSDIGKLTNLKVIYAISMIDTQDLKPLLKLQNLKEIHHWYSIEENTVYPELQAKGIIIK